MLLLINAEEALIRTQKMLRTLEHDELYHNLHCGNKNHKTVKSPRESSKYKIRTQKSIILDQSGLKTRWIKTEDSIFGSRLVFQNQYS